MRSLSVDDFLAVGSTGVIVDVRTPAEFEAGHIGGAINLPLFDNEERAIVGTLYVRTGRDEAVEKGLELVGPKLARFVREARALAQGRSLYIYCWRGGMRSGSMAWLLSTAGLEVHLLKGGYKAFRKNFETLLSTQPWRFVVLGGSTGCGKSEILHEMEQQGAQVLDLEGLANHKGSVFGGMGQPAQPTTEEFINRLHHRLREFDPTRIVWCEGESMLIGHLFIPQLLFDLMKRSHTILMELPMDLRIKRLVAEYGAFPIDNMVEAFHKIRKRLGSDRTDLAIEALQAGDTATAARIALHYYDKGYASSAADRNIKPENILQVTEDNPPATAQRLIEITHA